MMPSKRDYKLGIRILSTLYVFTALFIFNSIRAEVPEFEVTENGVQLKNVGPSNPIIYDNDWWFDVFDNNYLWAQVSLGHADLRANIVTRDMWDWQKGYLYKMEACVKDAKKALKLARNSGLRNIPDLTLGSDRILKRPESGLIKDTKTYSTAGSRLIIKEALKASPKKPLLIICGGPLTTVANALLEKPEISPNIIVFSLTVASYGYNGKDAWSPYIVAKKAKLVDWATGSFWDKNSVFTKEHFKGLPQNPFCQDMKRLIQSNLGQANQLGDGAPLVWLWKNSCWKNAVRRKAVWAGRYPKFEVVKAGESADVLDIPKAKTDLVASRKEFFRVLTQKAVYQPTPKKSNDEKLRVVILTDMSNEPDDQMSLVRFLTYANEFDVEGLIATTSCWKKKDPDIKTMFKVLDAYEKDYKNLILHSKDYPTPAELRKVTKSGVDGYGMKPVPKQLDNEAVQLIVSALLKDDPRPIWFCAWGGANTLAAAVMKLSQDRPNEIRKIVSKIRGYEIALQDEGFAYIAKKFPEVPLISAKELWRGISRTTKKFNAWSHSWGGDNSLFSEGWVSKNVQKNHGALGKNYPSADYLWEGDTPSFLFLIPNGLNYPEKIGYGGWGGRFEYKKVANVRSGTGNNTVDPLLDQYKNYYLYSDAKDSWSYQGKTYKNEYASVFRWRQAFQNDFEARMDRCVKPFEEVNHAPVPVVDGDSTRKLINVVTSANKEIVLDASNSSDPDGNQLKFNWWIYSEPGTYQGKVELFNSNTPKVKIKIPPDSKGKNFHVILNVTDDGTPKLTSYRRVLVTVNP